MPFLECRHFSRCEHSDSVMKGSDWGLMGDETARLRAYSVLMSENERNNEPKAREDGGLASSFGRISVKKTSQWDGGVQYQS